MILKRSIEGRIGVGNAADFFAFTKVGHKLPKPADILRNPERTPIPKPHELDVSYAVANMVVSMATRDGATVDEVTSCTTYLLRLEKELAVKGIMDISNSDNHGSTLNSPKVAEFIHRNGALLTGIYTS